MWDAMKRHEIGVLARAGVPTHRIAETTEVPARSVRRIVGAMADDDATTRDGSEAPPSPRRPGRPSKVDAYRPLIAAILTAEPALPTMEILFRVRARG
ncbi:MAG: hypothetical protein K8T90_09990 [Planctomycetes bacterium]|nr:hypothetical protein [Planctomycetota bacterium]